jgi:hypothetical protein
LAIAARPEENAALSALLIGSISSSSQRNSRLTPHETIPIREKRTKQELSRFSPFGFAIGFQSAIGIA